MSKLSQPPSLMIYSTSNPASKYKIRPAKFLMHKIGLGLFLNAFLLYLGACEFTCYAANKNIIARLIP